MQISCKRNINMKTCFGVAKPAPTLFNSGTESCVFGECLLAAPTLFRSIHSLDVQKQI